MSAKRYCQNFRFPVGTIITQGGILWNLFAFGDLLGFLPVIAVIIIFLVACQKRGQGGDDDDDYVKEEIIEEVEHTEEVFIYNGPPIQF